MRTPLAGAVGLICLALAGCGRDRGDDSDLALNGNVEVRQVALAFEDSGRVAEVRVDEGARVKAGAVLAILDTATLQLQALEAEAQSEVQRQALLRLRNGSRPEEIAQAQARLTAANAELARASDDLTRLQSVSERTGGRGVAAQDLDRAAREVVAANAKAAEQAEALRLARGGPRREDIASGEAQVRAADAQLALLRHRIDRSTLRAPVDGVVRARLLETGDLASPQKPVFEVSLTQPKWVRVYVNQLDLGRIRTGMAARVLSDSAPDQPLAGKVGYIASTAEFTPKSVETEELRTSLVYEVRVVVQDPSDRLKLGQPVSVRIATGAAS